VEVLALVENGSGVAPNQNRSLSPVQLASRLPEADGLSNHSHIGDESNVQLDAFDSLNVPFIDGILMKFARACGESELGEKIPLGLAAVYALQARDREVNVLEDSYRYLAYMRGNPTPLDRHPLRLEAESDLERRKEMESDAKKLHYWRHAVKNMEENMAVWKSKWGGMEYWVEIRRTVETEEADREKIFDFLLHRERGRVLERACSFLLQQTRYPLPRSPECTKFTRDVILRIHQIGIEFCRGVERLEFQNVERLLMNDEIGMVFPPISEPEIPLSEGSSDKGA
jgi:hypothetical protein